MQAAVVPQIHPDGAAITSQLILSGGEGYINFRIGANFLLAQHSYYTATFYIIFIFPLEMFF